jgi:hypothetical protein
MALVEEYLGSACSACGHERHDGTACQQKAEVAQKIARHSWLSGIGTKWRFLWEETHRA